MNRGGTRDRDQSTCRLNLPFAHLNLRCNPFGQLTRPEKNELAVLRLDLQPYAERLRIPGYALQFLKEGAPNKTTHMMGISRLLPDAVYVQLREGMPVPHIPEAPALFIDWMHLMPGDERREILRRQASFGIVSHVNHGREFKRAGLTYELVKLPMYTAEQLKVQVDRRIAWARRDPNRPVPAVSLETVSQLLAQFDDDVAVIEHLYDRFESLEEVADVQIFG